MASKLNISSASMWRIVKHKLEFYPYKIRRAYMLTEKMKQKKTPKHRLTGLRLRQNSRQLLQRGLRKYPSIPEVIICNLLWFEPK
uniref:HTH_Tnp_Tc3_1 domain-containing protein n=1 Tax=Heterorhabditis bacteriophora TaxID=37862 RepID=A0A1I7WJA1_HETBA